MRQLKMTCEFSAIRFFHATEGRIVGSFLLVVLFCTCNVEYCKAKLFRLIKKALF